MRVPDDDRYTDRDPAEVPFPGTVLIAGIIWMLIGGFTFAGGLLNMALVGAGNNPGGAPGGCCGLVFGIAFLSAGWNSVRGTASDTRGNAVGSIAFGVLYAGLAVIAVVVGVGAAGPAARAPGDDVVMLVTGVVVAGFATLFLAAGILALYGRRQYLDWREVENDRRQYRRARNESDRYDDRRD